MKTQEIDLIKKLQFQDQKVTLEDSENKINIKNHLCSNFIKPLNALARGEFYNSSLFSRNASIAVISLNQKKKGGERNSEKICDNMIV